ncbi:MAG: hypothetical protein AAGA44_16975 [Pseudomonadota bacterium]
MRKQVAISCLGALLGCSYTAHADDRKGGVSGMTADESVRVTVAYYPDAWCIDSFLAAAQQPANIARRAKPSLDSTPGIVRRTSTLNAPAPDLSSAVYADRSSFMERLRSLKSRPLATLWRGQDTALVLRVQNGGYFGISIDDTRYDAD